MRYAVFDWDNTIRKGFTLFSWIDFLYDEGILNKKFGQKIEKIQTRYVEGKINHDEYAKIACEVYAKEMKGISEDERKELLDKYIENDKESIFSFADDIFECMYCYSIKPIVISGAPRYIVEYYAKRFGLYEIYAFSENYVDGYCDGGVNYNYGMNKKNTIEKLCKLYGDRPIVGFGDSYSDIPIFDMSYHSFCIISNSEDNNSFTYGKQVNYIRNNISGLQIKNMLERILK